MEEQGMVYLIQNTLNDKRYVGQTTKTLDERFIQHARTDSLIGNAIRKYGAENFRREVLEVCDTQDRLNEREIFWIAYFNCKAPNGYNLTDGGEGIVGLKRTPEHCAKLSAARKGKPLSPEHRAKIAAALSGVKKSPEHVAKVVAANTGKKRSPEICAKMSATKKGKKRSAEAVAKTALANTGKKRSSETKAKMSAAHKGVPKSPEHRAKLSAVQVGKKRGPRSAETKAKISAKNTGKKRSSEARAKMSAAHLGKKSEPHSAETRAKIAAARHKSSPFQNLVAELDARQISYTALAEYMELASVTISHKMSGRRKFTDSDKKKLAEFFGKPVEYLLQRND